MIVGTGHIVGIAMEGWFLDAKEECCEDGIEGCYDIAYEPGGCAGQQRLAWFLMSLSM